MDRAKLHVFAITILVTVLSGDSRAQVQLWQVRHDDPGESFTDAVVVFGDVDNDGVADVAFGFQPRDELHVVSGATGTLLYTMESYCDTSPETFPNDLAAGDTDGDGRPELIAAHYGLTSDGCLGWDYIGAVLRLDATDGRVLESRHGRKWGIPIGACVAVESGVGPTVGDVGWWYQGEVFVWAGYESSAIEGESLHGALPPAPYEIGGLGDIDGDGRNDLAIVGLDASYARGVYGYSGADKSPLFSIPAADDSFGAVVAAVGDADGDGISDFLVSSHLEDGAAGADCGVVYLYSGGDGTPLIRRIEGGVAGARLGYSLAGVGDVDDDGCGDFAVGAPGDYWTDLPTPEVFVLSGRTGIVLARFEALEQIGTALAGGTDLNGDGIPDLVIEARPGKAGNGTVTAWALDRNPVVASVDPARGRYDSMPVVTILGANFRGDPVTVEFDGVASSDVTVLSSWEVAAVVPVGTPGLAEVRVTTPTGSGALDAAYAYTPAVLIDGDFVPGGAVTLRIWIDAGDEVLCVSGLAPEVPTPTPPYFGELCVQPFTVCFYDPGWPQDEIRFDETLPNDPSLSGITLLVQSLAGPRLTSHPKDGAWTNCGSITIQ